MSEYQYADSAQIKPGKLQTLAILTLISGIVTIVLVISLATVGILTGVSTALSLAMATAGIGALSCLCIPVCALVWLYGLAVGILGIIFGIKLMATPPTIQKAPKFLAIMQIVNILNFDVFSTVVGILALVFYNDPEVQAYLQAVLPPAEPAY